MGLPRERKYVDKGSKKRAPPSASPEQAVANLVAPRSDVWNDFWNDFWMVLGMNSGPEKLVGAR